MNKIKDNQILPTCNHAGLNRRDFLHLAGLVSALSASSVGIQSCTTSSSKEPPLRIGYVPITDATPLLIGHAKGFFADEGLNVEHPVLIRGFTDLSEAFLAKQFNFVHLMFPLPIFMRYKQHQLVKVVAWNHINGSAITVGNHTSIETLEEIGGRNIAVPHWYSTGNVILQLCLRKFGIEAVIQDRKQKLSDKQTNLVMLKAPDMLPALSNGSIDGYIVAEPFPAAGEVLAHAKILRFTGDIYKNHPCCVAAMHESDLQRHPEWAQKVVNGLVKAELWARQNLKEAAHILSREGNSYLPFAADIIYRSMAKYDMETYGNPPGHGAIRHPDWEMNRIDFQPFPYLSTTKEFVQLLKQTKVEGDHNFLQALDPDTVAHELFNYELVKIAAAKIGGLKQFGGVNPQNPYSRQEIIEV